MYKLVSIWPCPTPDADVVPHPLRGAVGDEPVDGVFQAGEDGDEDTYIRYILVMSYITDSK